MSFYRKFENAFILLLAVFLLGFLKLAYASETTTLPAAPEETKKQSTASSPQIIPPQELLSDKLNRNAIGCILPLSGQYADWGQKALDAIKLSASIAGKENKRAWEIVVEDSQNSPDKTKIAVANLANVRNVIAIIAVTEAAEALETAREANKWKVPIMMITSKEGVTSAGEYVFQHFLTPSQQIRSLVKYAIDDLNCAIFSILYPQDEYGEEMTRIFRKEVAGDGGKVEKAIAYGKKQTNFLSEINNLTGSNVKSRAKVKADKEDEQDQVPVDFEALFIPDSYAQAKLIASQLDFYNVKGFYLLGTSLWNSPNLLKNGAAYLEGTVFADSFFKDGSFAETYMFVDAYNEAYKRNPENIDALAFDTAGIIFSVLENENLKTRRELAAALSKIGVYDGATGSMYFDANRVAQKTAFILRVQKGKLEQVK